jgi:hypothetical protein
MVLIVTDVLTVKNNFIRQYLFIKIEIIMPVKINEDALAQLGKKVSKGNSNFLDASKALNPTLHVRLMLGLPNMDGVPFFHEEGYWINKKRYVSPKTFGLPCPIQDEIEEAMALNDPEIIELLESRMFSSKPTIMALY